MKKLVLIILIAVYGLAVAGAGIAPVISDAHGFCAHAQGFPGGNNEGDAGSCSSETCNTGYTGFTVKEHQHASRQFHFSFKHVVNPAEGYLSATAKLIQPTRIFAATTRTPGAPVPAYILLCVYRL